MSYSARTPFWVDWRRHTDDGRLSYDEMFFIAVLLLLAGNETTTNMLSTLFLTLAERPDQLELLQRAAGAHRFGDRGAAAVQLAGPKLLPHSAGRLSGSDHATIPAKGSRVSAGLGCGQP